MNLSIHSSFLPHGDADTALAFWRDTLGLEVRKDVAYNGMRWITVGPVGQPDTRRHAWTKPEPQPDRESVTRTFVRIALDRGRSTASCHDRRNRRDQGDA